MNDVEPAWPNLCLREEYADQTAWTDRKMTSRDGRSLEDSNWHVVGIIDDLYILLNNDGTVAYAKMDWLWEGNG